MRKFTCPECEEYTSVKGALYIQNRIGESGGGWYICSACRQIPEKDRKFRTYGLIEVKN